MENQIAGTLQGMGYLTDATGKPSDTRLKSWVLFVFSILIAVVIMIMFILDHNGATIDEYQVPFMLFSICLVGGASWQLLGKVLETMASKRIQ